MNLFEYLNSYLENNSGGVSEAWLKKLDGATVLELDSRGRDGSRKGVIHFCSKGFSSGIYLKGLWSGSKCNCHDFPGKDSWCLAITGEGVEYSENDTTRIKVVSLANGKPLSSLIVKRKKKVVTVDEKIEGRNLISSKKKDFYKDFQIGVEVEGEYILNHAAIEQKSDGYFSDSEGTMKGDGSIIRRNSGYRIELVTPIVTTFTAEKDFIAALTAISVSQKGGKVFSYKNNSAGTHIHVDFSESFRRDFEKNFGIPYHYNMMRLFDSVEFEKFFFKRYFETFHLKKFWERLQNSYCQSFLTATDDRVVDDSWSVIEKKKAEGGRYKWLNYNCLPSGYGIEFRIFPHMQTAKGMTKVISFTQRVLMEYLEKRGTAKNFAIIRDFYKSKPFDLKKISDSDRVIYEAFRIENKLRCVADGYINEGRPSFDVMKFVATIKKK